MERLRTIKKEAIMACETFDDLLNAEYGERGTTEREEFETQAETFCLAECNPFPNLQRTGQAGVV